MKIQNISCMNFNGQVSLRDRVKIAQEIASGDPEQQASLIGNINTLKQRLKQQTPDHKNYTIDFERNYVRSSGEDEYGHPYTEGYDGVVTVIDNDNDKEIKYTSTVKLSRKRDGIVQKADGEQIWRDGFMNLTTEILRQFRDEPKHPVDAETQAVMDKLV